MELSIIQGQLTGNAAAGLGFVSFRLRTQKQLLVDSFPRLYVMVIIDFKSSAGLVIAQPFFHHRFDYMLLEVQCASLVWHSFWHSKHPTCFSVYHTV